MAAPTPPSDPVGALRKNAHALDRLLDNQGRVTRWPRKRRSERALILDYLAAHLPQDEVLTEADIGRRIGRLHTFNDTALLRREMVDAGLLTRTPDGSQYWKPD